MWTSFSHMHMYMYIHVQGVIQKEGIPPFRKKNHGNFNTTCTTMYMYMLIWHVSSVINTKHAFLLLTKTLVWNPVYMYTCSASTYMYMLHGLPFYMYICTCTCYMAYSSTCTCVHHDNDDLHVSIVFYTCMYNCTCTCTHVQSISTCTCLKTGHSVFHSILSHCSCYIF